MKKVSIVFGALVFSVFFIASCGSKSQSAGSVSSEGSFAHSCGHCGKGFNGGAYIKDSGGDVMSVSSSEVESFPGHYCSRSCASLD